MTRRRLLQAASGALGVGVAGYAWAERQGVTRADLDTEAAAGLDSLLAHAALAPSGHNTQPWRVTLGEDGGMRIGSDRARWLPKVDPENREMALSIGAFLESLLVAAPGHGYTADFAITGGQPSDDSLIGVTVARGTETGKDGLERLRTRRTIRNGQLGRPLSGEDAGWLAGTFEGRTQYYPRESREGRYLAEGTIAANQVQALRDEAQAELARWIRFSNGEARLHQDGLTQESMEIAGIAGWYVRHFLRGDSVMGSTFREQGVERVREQVGRCGGWLIVTSPDSSIASLVDTERRTQRMWLRARERGLGIHPMTQMLEEAPFREQIGKELGIGSPIQFVLRVGHVDEYPGPVSLRRPVSTFVGR